MNQEHTEYLFKNFPFFHPEAPITESLMAFGFECGDGWFNLIKGLCESLDALQLSDFEVVQVKEDCGGLRFYVDFDPGVDEEKVRAAECFIEKAEAKSYAICEICGKPGKPNNSGWIQTRCLSCQ